MNNEKDLGKTLLEIAPLITGVQMVRKIVEYGTKTPEEMKAFQEGLSVGIASGFYIAIAELKKHD